jgi:8-oxo-dGTP pyrophosphatase MutT (NUDIX family)
MILSAGIIVLRREQGEWRSLFLRAYRNWDFPKGEVEPGESPLETAIRETREETGIAELAFRWGEAFTETEPYNRGTKKARYYLAETPLSEVAFAVNPQIGRPEHHEYRWLSWPDLHRLAPPRLKPVASWAEQVVRA